MTELPPGDCLETRVHRNRGSLTSRRSSYVLLHPSLICSGTVLSPFLFSGLICCFLLLFQNSKCPWASSLVDIFSLGELIQSPSSEYLQNLAIFFLSPPLPAPASLTWTTAVTSSSGSPSFHPQPCSLFSSQQPEEAC